MPGAYFARTWLIMRAVRQQLDVLVAGSRGYGPLGAVLLGSTTRELMHGAGCPVVIVPRGRALGLGDG